jgi:ubiquinone/menaquinone biosynthesis C-methylase UbiE
MLEALNAQPGDRVLFLGIPGIAVLERLSARVEHGVVVCIGEREEVWQARTAAVHLENVMFVPASPDEIPWQDGYFNFVVRLTAMPEESPLVAREIARVLAGGGALTTLSWNGAD